MSWASCRRAFWLAFLSILPPSAIAWNAAGHRISAMIAWQCMDFATRNGVALVLRQHPDFERWQAHGNGSDPDLTAFVEASTWPDDIRHDQRFYTTGVDEPTPTVAGFPDMERRLAWHYVDRPLTLVENRHPSPGRLDQELEKLAATIADRDANSGERAYALPWLIHLVGDAHQPLHVGSRYGADGQGDGGGNRLLVNSPFPSRYASLSLHRYWDDLPGPPWLRGSRLESAAKALMARYPPPVPRGTPPQWLDESWQLAGQHGYPPGMDETPTIDFDYYEITLAIANRRVAEAGYRLAKLLQELCRDH